MPVRAAAARGSRGEQAPGVGLRATSREALSYCSLVDLNRFAVDLS
jgi:hypothetical protein